MAEVVANIKIEPMVVKWGEDIAQQQLITCIADVSGSLNNQYFMLYDVDGTRRYVWLNVNSAGTDPAISGATELEVALSTNSTAAATATAIASAIDGLAGYTASASGSVITVNHVAFGIAKPAHDGGADTGFTFEVVKYGDQVEELGLTDGSIEVATEAQNVDVTAHQSGSEIISHINTGNNVSITVSIKETTMAKLKKAFIQMGDAALPEGTGASATEVFGWGISRQFKQSHERARKLVLHPKVLPESNYSRDLCFWKAFAMPESLSFSGEEILTLPVNFMCYLDSSKPSAIQKFCYGDHTQF